jgi:6-phosphogluconolactonase (cycloisomerase 2 family)
VPIPSLIYIHLFFLPQFFIMLHTFHTLRRAAALLALSALPLATHAQVLEYVGSNSDSVVYSATSPHITADGQHFYVGQFINSAQQRNGLVHFTRNTTTGVLTFANKYTVDTANGFFFSVTELTSSANGNFLYTTSITHDLISVFTRNTSTGAITPLARYRDNQGGVDGLDGARDITISPDGKNVYATGSIDHAVAVFDRDTTTGLLTFREVHKNNISGVTGLTTASQIKVSPNGQFVYAVGRDDDAIVTFSRNSTTGALTFVNNYAIPYLAAIGQPTSFDLSNNGAFAVVAGTNDSSIHILSINQTTGVPSAFQVIKEGVNGVSGVLYQFVQSVRFSPDFMYLYVTTASSSPTMGRFLVFVRNTTDNTFSLVENKTLNTATQERYDIGAVLSSDSRFIYNMRINSSQPFYTIETHQDTTTRVIVSVEQFGAQQENTITNVYPNPSKGAVYFDCPSINDGVALRLRLVDVLGRELYNRELVVSGGRLEADFSALPHGAYYVQLGSKAVALRLD